MIPVADRHSKGYKRYGMSILIYGSVSHPNTRLYLLSFRMASCEPLKYQVHYHLDPIPDPQRYDYHMRSAQEQRQQEQQIIII